MTHSGASTPPTSYAVVLHEVDGSPSVNPADVYFTFGDGRLAYDCVSCNAKCCRGFGYFVTAGPELARQVESRRSLPLFVAPRSADNPLQHTMVNCAPACFFLSDSGLCEVHAQHGHAAKPETCRLFPFNNLRRVGRFLVVAPHSYMCPLGVSPRGQTSECSDHQALLEAMSAKGISARVRSCSTVRVQPADVIALERSIALASEDALEQNDYLAFVRQQIRLQSGNDTAAAHVSVATVDDVLRLVTELLDCPTEAELGSDSDLIRTMVAATPFLRSQFVFLDAVDDGDVHDASVSLARIPLAMLCIYLIAESARAAGMKRVTFQTLTKIEQEFRALVEVMAHVDTVMVWRDDISIRWTRFDTADSRLRFIRLAKALLPASQRSRNRRLGDVLREHAPKEPVERSMFLKRAAGYLARKLVPLSENMPDSQSRRRRTRLTNVVQRWILLHADESLVSAAQERLDARRRPPAASN